MMHKLTRLTTRTLALLFALCATGGAWAADKTNPVTGATESYSNVFTGGTDSEWNKVANWTLATESKVPFVSSGDYNAALVDGKTATSASTAIDGWQLRVGAYNGATVTWSSGITKIQASNTGCWLTADETSSITIASFAGNQLEGSDAYPFKLSSANAGGITWSAGLTASSNTSLPFWYYLKGTGTVVYGGSITVANAQVIKMADVTLSGTSRVVSKTLVTFGSGTTKTFTADATIKRLNSSGTDLENDAHVATVNSTGTTTLTTANAVGTCELVQTSTGIVLYWVDGDPANLPAATVYKPSININFTSGTALSTSADVGLGDYAIPGTSWNNLAGSNGSLSALKAADSSGATFATAASVTISGARGSYSCSSLTAASDLRHGYIDESTSGLTPTITVSGIPYEKYRVIVYTATDAASKTFGYLTINGKNYTYVNSALTEDTTAWGNSGGQNTAEPIAEGVNVLVSPVTLGSTLTVVGHRNGNDTRGCIAAVQIVEYVPEIGENDLKIIVPGDTTYTVDEAKTLSGTVYLVGNGTLTLDGSAKITAATIDVGKNVVLNINADRLDATTFTGLGTVVYEGKKPVSDNGWTDNSAWKGTVWVKNIPVDSDERKDWNPALYGNADSTLRFTNVNLYFPDDTATVFSGTINLDGAGMNICDGYGGSIATIARLTGSGTLSTNGGSSNGNGLTINDASEFVGTITLTKYKVIVGSSTGTSASGVLQIDSGKVATVASGMTWTAPGGFEVNGTLNANGMLTSSATPAVSGAGTVVFTGRAPTVSGDAWWKNSGWTGTVQVKDVTNMVGDDRTGTYLQFNEYGNSGSVVEMNNVTGWLPTSFTCTPKLKVTGSLYLNNGGSNKANAFKVGTLLGSGTISGDGSAGTVVFNVTDDWSGFTGTFALNNKCIVFGSTIPDTLAAGTIYISEGAVVTPQQSSGVWWGVGGIKVDGELRAPNLGKFGGGTTITTTDNGVFTLTDSNNTDDKGVDYARITGTGTLRYADVSGKWRALSAVNFPTGMICENNLSAGLILTTQGDNTIGSLAGSGQMRSDWGGSGNTGDRDLLILQARDTTYSGVFASSNDRVRDVYVKPGVNSSGTLTLSGAQTTSNGLIVESDAKVKITGTWNGATTVKGSLAIGDTGKIDGAVTTVAGSTLDYTTATGDSHITGALTLTETTTVKLPENPVFPYKLAASISGVTFLAATQYTIGETAGKYPLGITPEGAVYIKASASIDEDGEDTISWDELNWAPSESEGLTVTARKSRTLNLGTATANKITFDVEANKTLTLAGTLTAPEITFTGGGKVVCSAANTLQGTIKGDATITIEYPDKTLPTGATWTNATWEGTLVLANCGHLNSDTPRTRVRVPFEEFGSANSKIRAPGFKGFAAVANASTAGNAYCAATLVIEASDVFEFNHGWQAQGDSDIYAENENAGYKFAKLAGTGRLFLDGTTDYAQYIFTDVSGFTGTVDITFPGTGGRKSYIFGANGVLGTSVPANLVIAANTSATVSAGKTWDIPAGVIIDSGATLNLGDGSTATVLSSRSEGTLAVAAYASATVTNIMDSVMTAKLNIGSGATLNITDTSLTTLTLPADENDTTWTYRNNGTLDLTGCTALTKLYLVLGESKTVDFTDNKIKLPTACKTVYLNIGAKRTLTDYTVPSVDGVTFIYYAEETAAEYANGGFEATAVPDGVTMILKRRSGMEVDTGHTGTTRSYEGGRSFAGAACWHEWDFEQANDADKLSDTGMYSDDKADEKTGELIALSTGEKTAVYSTVSAQGRIETFHVISAASNPFAAVPFETTWSAAVRCTMPTGTGKVGIAFGDTDNGILGLASGSEAGDVDLFNWTSAGGYRALAQFKVEKATTDMHIYVFTVNDGTVSLYRDGEFIHTASFSLEETDDNKMKFMVGDVCDRAGSETGLPAVAADGYVDYVRLYYTILPQSDIEGLSRRRPFVSAIDSFERTIGVNDAWNEAGTWTWTKANGAGVATADYPHISGANVTVGSEDVTTLSLNLDSDIKYGTLKFTGTDIISLVQAGTGAIGAEMLVVRSGAKLTADYNAVDFSDSTVGVDAGAKLTFNLANYPFAGVTATKTITLIGYVPEAASEDARARYAISVPDTLPAHIASVVASWSGGGSYQVTITPDHTAEAEVYYGGNYISGVMDGNNGTGTVYTDAALSNQTKLFPGDTLVISDAWTRQDNTAWISDTFANDIKVTRTTLNLKPGVDSAVLNNRSITVESGKTLNLYKEGARAFNFGSLKLDGTGTINIKDDATVASLSGTAGIVVDGGATLTLGSIATFVTGGVSGTGTVELPAITGSIDFNTYGNANSTVEVTGVTDGELTSGGACRPALLIDAAATFVSVGTYAFAKISGSGNLTFPAESAVTISDLVDYTGTVANNSSTAVTVTKLTKTGIFVGGAVLLTKDGSGTVTISSVEVDGVAKHGEWFGNDFCLVAAEYNGTKYKTVAAAISAAGDENIGDITVFDTLETLPAGYRYVEGETTTVAKRPFALVISGTPANYDVARDVVIAAAVASVVGSGYEYIEVRVGGNVDIPLLADGLKIKNTGGADINFTELSDEYEPNPVEDDGYITYNVTEKPTIYTWTGAAFDSITGDADLRWEAIGNWSYVDSDSKTQTASRQPQAGDTVVFNSAAEGVTIGSNTSVAAIRVGAAVSLSKAQYATVTLTATTENGIVLTDKDATITVSGVTLSPTPTTNVSRSRVVSSTVDGTTTYRVELIPGTIFSVY